jgi:hypothetical protein
MQDALNLRYAELCKQLGDCQFKIKLLQDASADLIKQIDALNQTLASVNSQKVTENGIEKKTN